MNASDAPQSDSTDASGLLSENPSTAAAARRAARTFSVLGIGGGLVAAVVAILWGGFFWSSTAIAPGVVPVVAGIIVLGSTIWGSWYLRRIMGRRLTSLRLSPGGLEGNLVSGLPFAVLWSDPKVHLRLLPGARAAQGPTPRYSIRIGERADAYGWDLTADAVSRLSDAARQNGLTVSENRVRSGQTPVVQIEIHR